MSSAAGSGHGGKMGRLGTEGQVCGCWDDRGSPAHGSTSPASSNRPTALAAPPALPACRLQASQARVRDLEQQMDRLAEHLNSTEVGAGARACCGVCWGGAG